MKRLLMAVVICGVVGCGEKAPEFHDEGEELRYLNAVANPSVEQFRRREVLAKADQERRDAQEREARIKQEAQERLMRRTELAQNLLKDAKSLEKDGSLGLAKQSYQILVDDYSDLPESKDAAEGLKRCSP